MENNIIIYNKRLDMASEANAIKEFHGKESEDFNAWVKEVKMIAQVAELDLSYC